MVSSFWRWAAPILVAHTNLRFYIITYLKKLRRSRRSTSKINFHFLFSITSYENYEQLIHEAKQESSFSIKAGTYNCFICERKNMKNCFHTSIFSLALQVRWEIIYQYMCDVADIPMRVFCILIYWQYLHKIHRYKTKKCILFCFVIHTHHHNCRGIENWF